MNQQKRSILNHDFSIAFKQTCSVIAIGKTKSHEDTLKELLLQCMVCLPDDQYFSAKEFLEAINGLFGLVVAEHEIEFLIDLLIQNNILIKQQNGAILLSHEHELELKEKIRNSLDLEQKIYSDWKEEIFKEYPSLEFELTWKALKKYLAYAFQRHGMQAIALLDPDTELFENHQNSLSTILSQVVREIFPKESFNDAKNAISDFMATTGKYSERAKYISELADGAFNYYNLTISPDVADNFRKNLSPLSIFLDTNFLFGILDITVNQQVAVSLELLDVIKNYDLPFELFAHQATINELITSITTYETDLRERRWPESISRAALKSKSLSGVELRFHQRRMEEHIDVDTFFMPFKHPDVLLGQKNIEVFYPEEDRLAERTKLIEEYTDFLTERNKTKSYRLKDHDMTVLDHVRKLRKSTKSTLDSGALLITCDYSVYKFDWETSKREGIAASAVLPNIFWQLIRPFIPSNEDFDKAFAETFAIPEFRILGSYASEACKKMLNILASYKDFPEETATRMLSNDLFVQKLQTLESDEEFQNYVESEIIRTNEDLIEENKNLELQLGDKNREANKIKEELITQVEENDKTRKELDKRENDVLRLSDELDEEKESRHSAENQAGKYKEELDQTSTSEKVFRWVSFLSVCTISVAAFELCANLIPINFIVSQPNSLSIQIVICILIIQLITCIFFPKQRKTIITTMLIPGIYLIIQLLSGTNQNTNA